MEIRRASPVAAVAAAGHLYELAVAEPYRQRGVGRQARASSGMDTSQRVSRRGRR